jgi:F0F1-type ATP synthase assembly protein I
VLSNELVRSKRLVIRVVLLQSGCAVLAACLFFVSVGSRSALSALTGGLIVAFGSALFGWRMFKPGIAAAGTLGTAMYAGLALKWVWFALALYLALARWQLGALPLLAGIAFAQVGYWVGLLRLK